MMTIEQFRSPELAALYSQRYVDRVLHYHAGIFRDLIAAGEIRKEDRTPEEDDMLALMLHGGERVRTEALRAVWDWYSAREARNAAGPERGL